MMKLLVRIVIVGKLTLFVQQLINQCAYLFFDNVHLFVYVSSTDGLIHKELAPELTGMSSWGLG